MTYRVFFLNNAVLTHHDLLSVTHSNIYDYFDNIYWTHSQIIRKQQTYTVKIIHLKLNRHVLTMYIYIIFNNYCILNHIALIKSSGNVAYEDSSIINSLYGYWKWFKLVLIKSNAVSCIYRLTVCSALKWGGTNGFEFSSPASNRKRHRK